MRGLSIISLALLMSVCTVGFSQTEKPALKYSTKVNTVGTPFIQISIVPEVLPADIDDIKAESTVKLMSGGTDLLMGLAPSNIRVRAADRSVKIVLNNLTMEQLDALVEDPGTAKIVLAGDLEIFLTDSTSYFYTKDEIAESSSGNLMFKSDQKAAYLDASGGAYAFMMNRFEVGFVPKGQSDTDNDEFMLDFGYRKSYSFINGNRAYFTTEGFISTNVDDSLNFLKVYPVSFRLTDTDNLSETVVEAGIEGTQRFNYWRFTANLEYRFLMENLINLSQGYNRLRLKPVVSAGLKLYSEQENIRTGDEGKNENSGQLYGSIYYVIPVFESFTIIADAEGFYDVNESVNPDKKIQFNYQISFGYELKDGFQSLLTYRNGKTNINYESDSLITLGILAQLTK